MLPGLSCTRTTTKAHKSALMAGDVTCARAERLAIAHLSKSCAERQEYSAARSGHDSEDAEAPSRGDKAVNLTESTPDGDHIRREVRLRMPSRNLLHSATGVWVVRRLFSARMIRPRQAQSWKRSLTLKSSRNEHELAHARTLCGGRVDVSASGPS